MPVSAVVASRRILSREGEAVETHVDAVDRTNTVIKRRKGDASDTTEIHKEEVAGLGRESRCHGGADCKAFPLPARRLSCTHACGVHEQGAPAGAHDVQHLRRKGLRQVSVFSQQAEGPQIRFWTAALGPSLRRLQGASREPAAELRAEERGARGHELAQAVGGLRAMRLCTRHIPTPEFPL